MTREGHLSKANRNGRASESRTIQARSTERIVPGSRSVSGRGVARGASQAKRTRPGRQKKLVGLNSGSNDRKRSGLSIADLEFYRPLKKPVTLRLDADVLAWFKKDGRRYQTRINQALRQVMEREMRRLGK